MWLLIDAGITMRRNNRLPTNGSVVYLMDVHVQVVHTDGLRRNGVVRRPRVRGCVGKALTATATLARRVAQVNYGTLPDGIIPGGEMFADDLLQIKLQRIDWRSLHGCEVQAVSSDRWLSLRRVRRAARYRVRRGRGH